MEELLKLLKDYRHAAYRTGLTEAKRGMFSESFEKCEKKEATILSEIKHRLEQLIEG